MLHGFPYEFPFKRRSRAINNFKIETYRNFCLYKFTFIYMHCVYLHFWFARISTGLNAHFVSCT